MQADCRLVTVDPFDLFLPVPGPERPKSQVRTVIQRELRETVDPSILANPIARLHKKQLAPKPCAGKARQMPSLRTSSL